MMNIIMTMMTAMALLLVLAMITITAMVGVAVGVATATMTGAEAALEQAVERARGVMPAQAKETALFGLREAGSGVRKLRAGRAMILPDWFWVS
jgi:uncharacterized membrane protein YqiK